MQHTLDIDLKLKNTFQIDVIDSRTGAIKESIKGENITTNGFWIVGTKNTSRTYPGSGNKTTFPGEYLKFGSGTGTPAITDTDMFKYLWMVSCTGRKTINMSYPTSEFHFYYTVPATDSYVGSISEIGLYSNNSSGLQTHALLTDAEGNPITIEKSSFDILQITYAFFVTLNFPEKFIPVPAEYNSLLCFLGGDCGDVNHINGGWLILSTLFYYMAVVSDGYTRMYSGIGLLNTYNPRMCVSKPVCKGVGYGSNITYGVNSANLYFYCCLINGNQYEVYNNTSNTDIPIKPITVNTDNKVINISFPRLNVENANGIGFIQGIYFFGMGYYLFPNTDIFPIQTLTDIHVGTGDGVTNEFKCPLNYFIEDTEKIYVDGILLIPRVDYTVDSNNNLDKWLSLSAGHNATLIGGIRTNSSRALFKQNLGSVSIDNVHYDIEHYAVNPSNPLVMDMLNEAACNTLIMNSVLMYNASGNSVAFNTAVNIYLDYSNDNENYTNILEGTLNSEGVSYTFKTIIARYWRLRIDYNGQYPDTNKMCNGDGSSIDASRGQFLGYVGSGIIFTNPPVANSIITMDAQIDKPLKNSNFVIDIRAEIHWS